MYLSIYFPASHVFRESFANLSRSLYSMFTLRVTIRYFSCMILYWNIFQWIKGCKYQNTILDKLFICSARIVRAFAIQITFFNKNTIFFSSYSGREIVLKLFYIDSCFLIIKLAKFLYIEVSYYNLLMDIWIIQIHTGVEKLLNSLGHKCKAWVNQGKPLGTYFYGGTHTGRRYPDFFVN